MQSFVLIKMQPFSIASNFYWKSIVFTVTAEFENLFESVLYSNTKSRF